MRIATWNVNSLKARLPRVEEFLGYADVDVLCLQETKLADKTWPALTFRSSATSRCTTGRASGTASRFCRASASPILQRLRRRARRPVRGRRPRARRDVRRHPDRERVRAERPRGRHRVLRTQAAVVVVDARLDLGAVHTRTIRLSFRRLQRRARRPRRVGPEEVRRRDPRHRARTQGGHAARGMGYGRHVPRACIPTPTASTPTGTTAPATSTSTAACASTICSRPSPSPTASRGRSSTATRARAPALRPRPPHRRPRRLTARATASDEAAVRANSRARRASAGTPWSRAAKYGVVARARSEARVRAFHHARELEQTEHAVEREVRQVTSGLLAVARDQVGARRDVGIAPGTAMRRQASRLRPVRSTTR